MKAVTASMLAGEPAWAAMPLSSRSSASRIRSAFGLHQRLLGGAQGGDRPLSDLPRLGQGGVEQLRIGEGPGRDAALDGPGGVDPLGCEEELGGALAADRRLQQVGAGGLRNEAQAHEGEPQAHALAHVDHIAREQEGDADSDSHALRRRQQRLVEGEERLHAGVVAVGLAILPRLDLPLEGGEILAGGEVLAGARDHHHGDPLVAAGLVQRVAQRVPLRVVEGVLLLRAVQGEEQHAVVVELLEYGGFAHGSSFGASRKGRGSWVSDGRSSVSDTGPGRPGRPGEFRGRLAGCDPRLRV